jgi:hypothetical protein
MTRPDPYSILPCMLLDASVVRDVADSLDGRWTPEDEPDPIRRRQLVAAARLRLYGKRDRSGWYVVTYREARVAGLSRTGADWSVGFLADVSRFDDGPTEGDVQALARVHLESGMEAEAGLALAYAVLYERVKALVTVQPVRYRHSREFDLPERMQILTPAEAFADMDIATGEAPQHALPHDSPLARGRQWWVP